MLAPPMAVCKPSRLWPVEDSRLRIVSCADAGPADALNQAFCAAGGPYAFNLVYMAAPIQARWLSLALMRTGPYR